MAGKPKNVDAILTSAVEIRSPDRRAAYLAEACGDDADLRAQVERLIRAHFLAGSFLEEPVVGERPTAVVNALDETEGARCEVDLPPGEFSLDFLTPCDVPGRLGRLGSYEVLGVIGRGGMGVVLRAQDPKLNRIVAVKVLAPEFAANPTARKRFLREARAAAAVSHPHVITIHAVDDAGNTPYLVMEYVDGQSLQEKIDHDGTLQIEEILRIGSQIAAGLAAAHGQGLIHRDIKPANILLENGVERVKITDFGLARAVDDVDITRTGQVAGTPEFMSPEQAQGIPVEHRSDLFSLGSVLYAMCTGRSPFRADTVVAALRRVCDGVPRPIREVVPETPEWLVSLINRLLAKNPDERFQTAEKVADLLNQYLTDLQHPTRSPSPGRLEVTVEARQRTEPSAWAWGRSWRRPWLVAGLVPLVVLMGLAVTEATGVTHLATTVIRIATGESTLVVKIDDPAISVTIDGEGILIHGAGTTEVRLKPGTYRLRAKKDGQPVAIERELVSITRGGREVVNVKLLPPAAKAEIGEIQPPRQSDEVSWSAILPADAPAPAVAPFDAVTAKGHQQAWADYLGVPIEREIDLPGGEKLKLALIPPGEFLMGSSEEDRTRFLEEVKANKDTWAMARIPAEGPPHRVRISEPFYLGKQEVTQAQWEAVVGSNPSTFKAPNNPVEQVSWEDTHPFLEELNQEHEEEGMQFVLPTEAQWEYACRVGTTSAFCFDESNTTLDEFAWFRANAKGTSHPVAQRGPNAWGLYDMHGNVWEWCADWFAAEYYARSPSDDPRGPSTGSSRVYRGGSWYDFAETCRSAPRYYLPPGVRHHTLGFRVAAVLRNKSGR